MTNLDKIPFDHTDVKFIIKGKEYIYSLRHNLPPHELGAFLNEWLHSIDAINNEKNITVESLCEFIGNKHEDIRIYSARDWHTLHWIILQPSYEC